MKPSQANSETTRPQFGPVRARPAESCSASSGLDSCVVMSRVLTEAVDEMGIDAVGVELAGHQIAGAHPGAARPLSKTTPGFPGAPEAAGIIFTRSSASLTPRGLSGWASAKARTRVAATSWLTTVTQNSGRLPSYFAA